jgi:zinc transport system substrate-binding protein
VTGILREGLHMALTIISDKRRLMAMFLCPSAAAHRLRPQPLRRSRSTVLALAIVSLGFSSCGGGSDGASSERVQAIASSYPFGYVLEQVGGGAVDLQNLTQPGEEPHALELSPRQVADLGEADLVIYEAGFQAAVDDGIAEADLPDEAVIDVAEVADAGVTGFVTEHEHDKDGHDAEHNAEHEDGEHQEDVHGEELDPHVWLDPVRMQQVARAVEKRLVAADPDNAATYRGNAARLVGELEQLDRSFRTGLDDCERRTIVTAHAAFAYLAARYDLTQVAIAGLEPNTEPTPAQQAEVADLVEREGITTVFTEELVSSAVAESIADETGVRVARLDPVEGLSDDTADETYLTLMQANLNAIKSANGCT